MLLIGGAQQLTLTSQPQTSGTYCPGPVTFTCVGIQIGPGLFWQMNGSIVASYGFRPTDMFPLPLSVNPPLDGVMVTITNAAISPPGASTIDITSVLSVSDVSVLNKFPLQCCRTYFSCNTLNIEVSKFTQP